MSYTSQKSDPRSRITAVAGVVAAHAALGLAVVTGLSVVGIIEPEPGKIDGAMIIDLPPPPPKPDDPKPVPTQDPTRIVIEAPIPPLPLPTNTAVDVTPTDNRDSNLVDPFPRVTPTPGPVVTPIPSPVPTFTPRLARPANDQSRWVTSDDYPANDLRRENQGTVRYRLSIGSNGRVTACEVLTSAGSASLDEAACRNIARRARFDAATNEAGEKVVSTFTGTVRWEIPE